MAETILLVENEYALRELMRRFLEGSGYAVLNARDGDEALSVATAHPTPIDLLLTDVVMPGMSGLELSQNLKKSRPGMPVLFMSGYSEEVLSRVGFMGPGEAFFQKPVTPARLYAKIREILRLTSPQSHAAGASRPPLM